jgi:DNA replication and repair protein RecF
LLVIVLKKGETATKEELLGFMEGKIAKWWMPGDVVFVDEIPNTATGKIQKLTLRQRNAALKQEGSDQDLAAWEQELATSGEILAQQRAAYLSRLSAPLSTIGAALLDRPITLAHSRGWDADSPLIQALESGRTRDRRYRATQAGPHRGDVVVQVDGRPAKDHVSRGQQKLVAAALMLAQLEIQEQERPGRSALLLDDPAAELDAANLRRLMAIVQELPAQLWVTSLRAEIPGLPMGAKMFHVEQGRVTPAD